MTPEAFWGEAGQRLMASKTSYHNTSEGAKMSKEKIYIHEPDYYKREIIKAVHDINEPWVLDQIHRFIVNITK